METYYNVRRLNILALFAFLLGIFSATDIVYLFVFGNTPIMLEWVYGAVCFAILIISNSITYREVLNVVTVDLKLTFLFILLSIFPAILRNINALHLWWVGVIQVILNAFVIMDVIVLKEYKHEIIRGIKTGIYLNVLYIGLAYYMFLRGNSIWLGELFPALSDSIAKNTYGVFRFLGLFREPGHQMRYIAIMTMPIIGSMQQSESKKLKIMIFCTVIFVLSAISRSSSVLMLLLGIVIYILSSLKKRGKISSTGFVVFIIVTIVGFFALYTSSSLLSSLISGILDPFDSSNAGNNIRIQGIQAGIEIIKKYSVLGCGWNMFSTVFAASGFRTKYVLSAYSEILMFIAELGIFSLFYIHFFLRKSIGLIRHGMNVYSRCVGVALLIYFFEFCTTNYEIDGAVSLLIGLALIEWNDHKSLLT